jgi:pilus assembly protein Flp/PilA
MSDAFTKLVIYVQTAVAGARERQEGQTLVEYALILALVSIAAIAVLVLLGPQIAAILQQVTDALNV